jgi:hypothetical protein
MAVVDVTGLTAEFAKLSHWLEQQIAVVEVVGLAARLGELSHWLERQKSRFEILLTIVASELLLRR